VRLIAACVPGAALEIIISQVSPLGLIAGEGAFPILVARGARAARREVICCGLGDNPAPELRHEVTHYQKVGLLRIGQWIRVLKRFGCDEAIMVGRVGKSGMYRRSRYLQYLPDLRTLRLWLTDLRHDKRDHAVLLAVVRELAKEGITLIDSTRYCQDQLATPGVMTRRQPSEKQWEDIRFGWEMCRTISQMDIGQALAVLDKDVIAVEAIEGTSAMIERAGVYCRTGGWTLIKVGNINTDMRIDGPSIGVQTIESLHAAKAGCLVLETRKTIMLEKHKVLELADQCGIAVVGYELDPKAGG
jgi:DUF1009 family protein